MIRVPDQDATPYNRKRYAMTHKTSQGSITINDLRQSENVKSEKPRGAST